MLALVVAAAWTGPGAGAGRALGAAAAEPSPRGVLQAAGFLFFAFAGYARIATLGEEVRNPARTIPRAIPLALGITVAVYAAVASALGHTLGIAGLASSTAPLADAVEAAGHRGLIPVVALGAVVAALGSLLALVLGVSRTVFAMARDGHLPRALDAVHAVPHRAELVVGAVVCALVLAGDVRASIGFSSVCVLDYYAIANTSAWTLRPGPAGRVVPAVGLMGCAVLALDLPASSVAAGAATLAAGTALWVVRHRAHADLHR